MDDGPHILRIVDEHHGGPGRRVMCTHVVRVPTCHRNMIPCVNRCSTEVQAASMGPTSSRNCFRIRFSRRETCICVTPITSPISR